ncbi:hypothetical protein DH2020_032656 [Rehmannia glutinosa]|uniref:Naphthoate synthase n=1 Tax=Rehmannia glutinosa TaxID=99300 RepID=A0ABR0VEP1_REHGL
MAGMTGKDVETINRRMGFIARHLTPPQNLETNNSNNRISGSGCSSGGFNDTYNRVHGEVPTNIPEWKTASLDDSGKEFTGIIYEKAVGEGIAKITINRPNRKNAIQPHTVTELMRAFKDARDDSSIAGTKAFCSGGDQAQRGKGKEDYVDYHYFGRANFIDLQMQIRRLPKPVIAMVAGYALGAGQVLHMVCDLTIAADNAIFGEIGVKVGSFDAGYGPSVMARLVGPKRAREMMFMSRFYNASEAKEMGLINTIVPLEKLEEETIKWCREILRNSPMAIRVCKSVINATDDGYAGLQQIGGDLTLLFYGTEESAEAKNAYLERRKPDYSKFPKLP